MPSWQSYLLNPSLRVAVRRKLAGARSVEAVRSAFKGGMPAPKGARYVPDVVGGIAGEWVSSGGVPAATMLYLHGGGYMACSPATHRPITAAYANRGLRLFVPAYRLAPEHVFPAAVDDALAAYRGLLAAGTAPAGLALGGDSAGGGLALATLLAVRAAGLPLPACAIVFSPWTDLANTGESLRSNLRRDPMLVGNTMNDGAAFYLNGAEATNPLASPLYGELEGLPPLMIQVGESEVLLDDSRRFADRAAVAGVKVDLQIWAGMPHVWQIFQALLPEARQSMDAAAAFAKAHCRTI
jgi:acetyl esterase/lipase